MIAKIYSAIPYGYEGRIVEVEASDEEDAIEKVRQDYRKCRIVLDDSDYNYTDFSVKDEKSE